MKNTSPENGSGGGPKTGQGGGPKTGYKEDGTRRTEENKQLQTVVCGLDSSSPQEPELNGKDNINPKEVSAVIEIFRTVSPSLSYGNKTQRHAVENLIQFYLDDNRSIQEAYELVKDLSKSAVRCLREDIKFAPSITNPLELWNKFGKFISFIKKNSEYNL